jgi:UTP--glucose-1-phosphate uridylyltransferase
LASGEATEGHNRIRGEVTAPGVGDVRPLPPLGSDSRKELHARGEEAIRRGDVAAVVLAGGLRLTPAGEVFREDDGRASPYAPGHGDLTFSLRRAGILSAFRAAGGRVLYMSNVDNLAATLDPAVIGAHLEAGAAITAEVAPKEAGDKGGAPARVDGRAQIVEAFRFPEGFDPDRIPVFNTNSFVLDAEKIDQDFGLTWFAVRKKVDGRDAVQFERLVGELTAFLPSSFLRVERHGVDGRFQPVKDPEEMSLRLPEIVQVLEARQVL